MTGKYASKVRFNYNGLMNRDYSRDLMNEWEDSMKGAISADLVDEGCADEKMGFESARRYGRACEEVIYDLLFWVKWGHQRIMLKKDESNS